MFKRKIDKIEKIYEVFLILLKKSPRYPNNISEHDVLDLYERSIKICETVYHLESIYSIKGKIDIEKLNKGE